jgi:hypothetical protein
MQISPIVPESSAAQPGPVTGLRLDPDPGRVFAQYDLSAITSDEIDMLVKSLEVIGFRDTPFMLELETRSTRFRTRLAKNLQACGITQEIELDTSTPINLIEVMERQIEIARHKGNKTAFTERYLEKLESYLRQYQAARLHQRRRREAWTRITRN